MFSSDHAVGLVAFASDDETLINGSPGWMLSARNLRTGKDAMLPLEAQRVSVSPDGRLLAVLSDPATGANATNVPALKDLPAEEPPVDIPGLPSGAGHPGGAPLWDLSANTLRARLPVESRYLIDGVFSPDGRLFATAVSDNTIQLYDTRDGAPVGVCKGHKQIVSAVAISHDGQTLASASEDGTLRFWSVASRQELFSVPILGDRVRELKFSPDDQVLVSVFAPNSHGGRLRFYRTAP